MLTSAIRTIAPTVEPVTLAQAKAQARVVTDDDDALLATYIQAAREYAEQQCNRAILQQTWRASFSCFPRWRNLAVQDGRCPELRYYGPGSVLWAQSLAPLLLPMPALIGIVSITYLDTNGTQQTLDPSLYTVDYDGAPAGITPAPGTYWPATYPGLPNAVQVTYTAGFGNTPAAVPASLQLAILGLAAHFYENRESVVLTNSTNAVTVVPQFVDSLLAGYSVPAFTYEA